MSTETPKRRLRAEARRELIVDAALEEFAEHGYEGASMGRIGRAAGVARTVLYDHFPSKRALFVALLETHRDELMAHLREAITAEAPWRERMRASIDAFFAFAEREPEAWKLLFPEAAPVDQDAAAEHRRCRREANRLLSEMLAPTAREAGIDPTTNLGQATWALQQAALHGAVRWWHAHPGVTREELVNAAMRVVWGNGG
jgi:AcrR family transcriptional regulator